MKPRSPATPRRKRFEAAADWVLRHREGEHDRQSFTAWLESDPENRSAYEAAERLLGEARTAILGDPELESMPRQKRRRPLLLPALFAAVAVGGVFLALGGSLRLQADAVAGPDEMPELTLADGTIMQLNAGSAAAFRFTPERRTVTLLRGEAFFRVAHDPSRPFVVEAAGAATTALGTAFDVSIGDEATDVVVAQHAVAVAPRQGGNNPTRIEEGHAATYDAAGHVGVVRAVDATAALAWRRGQIVADDLPLTAVVAAIDRHFKGRIVVVGAARQRRVSGTFSILDADATLALLHQTLGLNVMHVGPLLLVHG